MLTYIVAVKVLDGYQLHLRFEDGIEGVIDVHELIPFEGIFAPLRDRAFFGQVRVNPALGAIYWPNGADLDPDVLYSCLKGQPIPSFLPGAFM